MDFFASQDLARRKTKWLIIYFVLAIICMIAGIYLVVVLALGAAGSRVEQAPPVALQIFDPILLAIVAVSVVTVVGFGSLYKVAELRGGGESVAAMLGGRRLPPNSRDPVERRILNVVEEMALAAGTPVPPVYLLDGEPGINAFAAGYTIDDAVIGINRGTIEQLNRDELQGVVAHEFSHILNGDMRMSIRMIGVLHGIQVLALIGYFILRGSGYGAYRSSSRNGKGAGAIILIAIGVIVIGSIGLFFARLIKASVSRQREYLADASAVQFTRNPDGIAGALKMIGAAQHGSVMESAQAEVASHMFFSNMFQYNVFNLLATHPPLLDRIQRVDQRFDGDYVAYTKSRYHRRIRREEEKPDKTAPGFPRMMPGFRILPEGMAEHFPIDPAILIAGIGLPSDDDVVYSQVLVDHIPEPLADAAREVFSARCIVFATLMDPSPQVRDRQLAIVARNEGQTSAEETVRWLPTVQSLDPRFRLPVFEILQGTLAGMSIEQYQTFHNTIEALVAADQEVDLFEFFLKHHLLVHLDRRFGKNLSTKVRFKAISPLANDVCLLIAILARVGTENDEEAAEAFRAGIGSIDPAWQDQAQRITQSFDYNELAAALHRLGESAPVIKKRVLSAAAIAITHDRHVTVEEAELFRAMSESLDCPVPPVVASPPPDRETIS